MSDQLKNYDRFQSDTIAAPSNAARPRNAAIPSNAELTVTTSELLKPSARSQSQSPILSATAPPATKDVVVDNVDDTTDTTDPQSEGRWVRCNCARRNG